MTMNTLKPGDRFGSRTLVSPIESASGRKRWVVRCDCGRVGSAREDGLRRGFADRCLDCARKAQPRPQGRSYVAGDRLGVFEIVDPGDTTLKLSQRVVGAVCTVCRSTFTRAIRSLIAGATVEAYGCTMCSQVEARRIVLDVLSDGEPRRTTELFRLSRGVRQQRHFQRLLDGLVEDGLVDKFHHPDHGARKWVYRITSPSEASTTGAATPAVR